MMTQTAQAPKLADDKFRMIRDLIYEMSGMYFGDGKKYLMESRLARRLGACGLKTYDEYYYFIKYDPGRAQEINRLFDEVTINETSFFRNPPQLDAFAKKILPGIVAEKEQKNTRNLRIWSAACSSGEEPYSLGIYVLESLKFSLPKWKVEIHASDLSEEILQKAKTGLYGDNSLRNTTPTYRSRYFVQANGKYAIRDEVKQLVQFQQINLSDKLKMRSMRGMDVIFCRNVLIYFDMESKKRVIAHLYDSLNPGGYMFIGHSESLHGVSKAFKLVHFPKAMVYQNA